MQRDTSIRGLHGKPHLYLPPCSTLSIIVPWARPSVHIPICSLTLKNKPLTSGSTLGITVPWARPSVHISVSFVCEILVKKFPKPWPAAMRDTRQTTENCHPLYMGIMEGKEEKMESITPGTATALGWGASARLLWASARLLWAGLGLRFFWSWAELYPKIVSPAP